MTRGTTMSSYIGLVSSSLQKGDFPVLAALLLVPNGKRSPHPALPDLFQSVQNVTVYSRMLSDLWKIGSGGPVG